MMNGTISNSEYEKYLVYPNETIDKLTVNRTFKRLFDAIDDKASSSELVLDEATETSYGTAKFSPSAEYLFEKPSEGDFDYEKSMLNIGQLYNLSKRMTESAENSFLVSPTSGSGDDRPISDVRYWIKSSYADSRFTFMPNGVNIVTCCFDIGFDGISNTLGIDSVDKDVVVPVKVESYPTMIDIDRDSHLNINDYISEMTAESPDTFDPNGVRCLERMDGKDMNVPFLIPMKATMRHNLCKYDKYSAYRQSYVEVCMSSSISIKALFDSKFGQNDYQLFDADTDSIKEEYDTTTRCDRKPRLFTQKPMVMGQICFYNSESNPSPLFGYDNGTSGEPLTSTFSSHNRISQKPLYDIDNEGVTVSPVNGTVLIRKVENKFDGSGNIVDNIIHFDVLFKFMAGSASDPEMDYAMRMMNSRSRVQFAMIGV